MKTFSWNPYRQKKDRCSRSPLLFHPSTHSRLVINFVWGSRLQLALCFCVGKSRLLAYACVVTIATNADRLTMPARTNLTWSLSHVPCSTDQPLKNQQMCLASEHKRDTQRDSWRPAMSQHPSLAPVCYLLREKLNLTLAPALIHFLCQGFFYSYTPSIHLFILIHAPSFRRQSKRGGGKKSMNVCM